MKSRQRIAGTAIWLTAVAGGIMATMVLIAGCSSEKPMAQPSSEHVKGNADRTFDRLKQEERDRKPAGM